MSVIAVASNGTRCCLAADSQVSQNTTKLTMSNTKVVRLGKLLLGVDGSLAMGDALRYHADGLDLGALAGDLPGWLSRNLVPWMRTYLKAADLMDKRDDGHEFPGSMLVARGREFLHIDCAGSVMCCASEWWAIGAGGATARGAMHYAAEVAGHNAEHVVTAGVEAACRLDTTCSLPMCVEWTEP